MPASPISSSDRPRRPKTEARLVAIYETAADLFRKNGYDATALDEIADAVGVTKPALYYYFKSKEDLLFALMRHGFERLDELVIRPSRQVSDPAARLREITRLYAAFVTGVGRNYSVLIHEGPGLSKVHFKAIAALRRNFYHYIRDTLIEIGDPRVHAQVAALSFFGVITWLAVWYEPGGNLGVEEIVNETVELVANRMLLGEPTSSAAGPKPKRRPRP